MRTETVQQPSEAEITYFGLQAYMGTTKHMGGLQSTHELIELCHIDGDSYVLDVGCGVGATACYLAKRCGCRVIGVDLRESMVVLSRERARREGVEDRAEFRVADAQSLPFEDAHFDAILCESVATFVKDKQQVVNEFNRVLKPGGYVGLNEETWLKTPPAGHVEAASAVWEIESEILTIDGWRDLLEEAGLHDVEVRNYKVDARRESSQVRRYSWRDMWRMFSRTLALYFKSTEFREYLQGRFRLPKDVFQYLGYGLFVGRKPDGR